MVSPNRIPEKSQDRDLQAVRRSVRSYGMVTRDPADPIKGWVWIRSDLSPPQMRVKIEDTTYKLEFTAV